MGNRGSKSEILQTQSPQRVSVKEQRVDGSWFLAQQARNLRCTLMGFERSYQINNPSKQFKFYSSTNISLKSGRRALNIFIYI